MKVILFGATGMVGSGALIECLEDPRVTAVVAVTRATTGARHPKLREVIHQDFMNYASVSGEFANAGAVFFCLGVTSIGKDEAAYTHLTYDLTMAAAKAIAAVTTDLTFCYFTGVGTDSSEQGRVMWARVKGRTENALLAMPFKAAYMFRPGYIQPMKGVRSKTAWYEAIYKVLGVVYGVVSRVAAGTVTTTEAIGLALIEVSAGGYGKRILYAREMNELAERARRRS